MTKSIYKILIVEDEKLMQELLTDRLSKEPIFKIYTASNGEEGFEVCREYIPDLILLDIKMPVMDGIMMMRELKKYEQLKDIPIIFLTNLDPDEDIIKKISEEKPSYYLIKAKTNLEDITERVKETLSAKRPTS